ncbi:hypothetical protein SDRG_09732 [Saprolegnia diclina VS20]|uniref:Uncharacterized protein n=1 Tax=Saprolegnia diclina (strain VS20) TaxID=1156394 RepID=T0QGK0_SAPDV|nr:hypothetical protein SDRG_09732 [Saprolegnia diclina VS20]EQC32760.1 hypothetical protein SDRG_09732 [Saprolegnia diclina VS20]|eukprot:XP_008613904.1 hypothetical protein SDRG_09732 [Saprolegnia diclina VS20]
MQCVWHSADLLREIMSFQLGVPHDTHTLMHALRSLVWDNADVLATLPPALWPIHDIFPDWFKVHGERGLKRLPLSVSLELFYYGLYYGNLDVIMYFCDKLPVDYVEWHLVVMSGNVVAVKFLLEAYPDGCFFQTIERAIEFGHLGVVRALRAHGVPWPATAWKVASQFGRADIAAYLDAYKCPWHEHWRGEVAEAAAEGGHVDVLRVLQRHHADAITETAMDAAAANGHVDAVAYLHTHGQAGCTSLALSTAVRAGHLDVVAFLAEHYELDKKLASLRLASPTSEIVDDVDDAQLREEHESWTSAWQSFQAKMQTLLASPSRPSTTTPKMHFRAIPRLI